MTQLPPSVTRSNASRHVYRITARRDISSHDTQRARWRRIRAPHARTPAPILRIESNAIAIVVDDAADDAVAHASRAHTYLRIIDELLTPVAGRNRHGADAWCEVAPFAEIVGHLGV